MLMKSMLMKSMGAMHHPSQAIAPMGRSGRPQCGCTSFSRRTDTPVISLSV